MTSFQLLTKSRKDVNQLKNEKYLRVLGLKKEKKPYNQKDIICNGDYNDVVKVPVEKNFVVVSVPTAGTTTVGGDSRAGGDANSGLSRCSDGAADEEILPVSGNVNGTDYNEDRNVPVSANFQKSTNIGENAHGNSGAGSDDEIISVPVNTHKSIRKMGRKTNNRDRVRVNRVPSRGRTIGGVNRGGVKKSKKCKTTGNIPGLSRYWTHAEHFLFLLGIVQFGYKDLKVISERVKTRNQMQVRTHSQKYFMRIMRECKRLFPFGADEHCPHYSKVEDEQLVCASCRNVINQENKYSVPKEYGLGLLCLVGEDTEEAVKESMGWSDKDYYG